MTGTPAVLDPVVAGLRPIVDPGLPARVRRRLSMLDPDARPAQDAPLSRPVRNARRALQVAVASMVLLGADFALVITVVLSNRSFERQQARLGELMILLAGQAVLVLLGMAASWLIGAVRALRRRAPLLRRRHASRYLTTGELSDLRLNTGQIGDLVVDAARQRDRVVASRAYQNGWLTASVDDFVLDTTVWRLACTALATATMMDTVGDAACFPELRDRAHAGARDIATALRTLRAELHLLTGLADAAAAIDSILAAADDRQRHQHTLAYLDEQLTCQRHALAAARAACPSLHDNLAAATATATYLDRTLTR